MFMWGKSRKKENDETAKLIAKDIERAKFHEREDIMFKKFPVGSVFKYLERPCCVVEHQSSIKSFSEYMPNLLTSLICNYVDNNGVIRHIEFGLSQAESIEAESE